MLRPTLRPQHYPPLSTYGTRSFKLECLLPGGEVLFRVSRRVPPQRLRKVSAAAKDLSETADSSFATCPAVSGHRLWHLVRYFSLRGEFALCQKTSLRGDFFFPATFFPARRVHTSRRHQLDLCPSFEDRGNSNEERRAGGGYVGSKTCWVALCPGFSGRTPSAPAPPTDVDGLRGDPHTFKLSKGS